MDEKNKDIKSEDLMAQEPSLAEMPLTEHKEVDYTFGNHDLRILSQSIMYNMDFPKEICSQIQKNYMDFAAFISDYIRDQNGNPLSLVHYCDLFEVKESGPAHDPTVDAVNLMNLYDAFLEKSELVLKEYKVLLQRPNGHLPKPVADAIVKLASGKDVSAKEFENGLKDYLS